MSLVLVSQVAPSPASSPPPLKTIVTVKTSPVCTALHEVVAPAVLDILVNDGQFEKSAPLLNQAGSGDVDEPRVGMAMMRLEYPETTIARNLIDAETRLDDPRLAQATSPAIDGIRKELEAVIDRQKTALNIISGTAETGSLYIDLHTEGAAMMDAANAPSLSTASSAGADPVLSLKKDDLVGVGAAGLVAYEAMLEQPHEQAAATLIEAVAPDCAKP